MEGAKLELLEHANAFPRAENSWAHSQCPAGTGGQESNL